MKYDHDRWYFTPTVQRLINQCLSLELIVKDGFALMIQVEKFVGGVGWVVGWLTPTTYIQIDGAG